MSLPSDILKSISPNMQEMPSGKSNPKKIKRTSFSPWSSGVVGSKSTAASAAPSTTRKEPESPEPLRIVSDILAPGDAEGAVKPVNELASHPKIMALQSQWEQRQKLAENGPSASGPLGQEETSSFTSTNTKGVKRPVVDTVLKHHSKKQKADSTSSFSSAASSPGLPPTTIAKLTHSRSSLPSGLTSTLNPSSSKGVISLRPEARAKARRFTEAAVEEQMEKIQSDQEPQESQEPQEPKKQETEGGTTKAKEFFERMQNGTYDFERESKPPGRGDHPYATSGPNKGERVTAIKMATPDRPYNMLCGPDGEMVPGRGVIFPSGYQLYSDPEYPFICPVRDCRRLFKNLIAISGHFGAGHNARTFNDNGDATLSTIGKYTQPISTVGMRGCPAIVISQTPLPPDAPPPASPGLSATALAKRERDLVRELNEGKLRPGTDSTHTKTLPIDTGSSLGSIPTSELLPRLSRPSTLPKIDTDVKDYLHSFLIPTQRSFKREDVRQMLKLPRLRDFPKPWIEAHRGSELDATLYTCALAFLVGDEVTGDEACTAIKWQAGANARLSEVCIKLPTSLVGRGLFSQTPTCVGCRYWSHRNHQGNHCDWVIRAQATANGKTSTTTAEAESMNTPDPGSKAPKSASVPVAGSASKAASEERAKSTDEDEDSGLGPRRTTRKVIAPVSYAPPRRRKGSLATSDTAETTEVVKTTEQSRTGQIGHPVHPIQTIRTTETAQTAEPNRASDHGGSTLAYALEMEEWEMAPGRRTNASSQPIAFSSSYLNSSQPVAISDFISVNNIVLKPGNSTNWSADFDTKRMITVIAGKVKVTIGDEAFDMGPQSIFVILPGHSCKALNRLYIDATLQCVTVADL
ncbi:hypothetical protein B0T10DRAFT_481239 [Thelonectria olida]|uniref:C2H2-type domain-containing protein n=1 Tax=Thelonectria olida TaxID=1576542 RepID=A0A9P8W8Z2_9HYPO|nr:hypothetical protein B0T10DRAFT_481239 [Thelonectria olida]